MEHYSKAIASGEKAAARIISGEWEDDSILRALWAEDGQRAAYRLGFDRVWLAR